MTLDIFGYILHLWQSKTASLLEAFQVKVNCTLPSNGNQNFVFLAKSCQIFNSTYCFLCLTDPNSHNCCYPEAMIKACSAFPHNISGIFHASFLLSKYTPIQTFFDSVRVCN